MNDFAYIERISYRAIIMMGFKSVWTIKQIETLPYACIRMMNTKHLTGWNFDEVVCTMN